MTDIFTHAVVISNLSATWKKNMRILDIGTGHGYLSFLIAKILKNKGLEGHSINGIDIYKESIEECEKIGWQHFKEEAAGVRFSCCDL